MIRKSLVVVSLLIACLFLMTACKNSRREQFLSRKNLVLICQHHLSETTLPEDLQANPDSLDILAPMWFDILDDGNLSPIKAGGSYQAHINFCRKNQIALLPIVRNFKPHKLLGSPEAVDRAIQEIESLVQREGFDGLTLDIEESGTDPATREPMLHLMRELHLRMKKADKLFCVTFSPIPWERENGWQGEVMLEHCDWAFGMFYDYCGPWNKNKRPPTSTAPQDWPSSQWDIRRDVKKILTTANAPKILFGIPAYGNNAAFDSTGTCVSLEARSAASLLALQDKTGAQRKWDAEARTPYFEYTQGQLTHRVWYEDAESYTWRMQLAADQRCAGIALWSIGAPGGTDPAFWPAIREYRRSNAGK